MAKRIELVGGPRDGTELEVDDNAGPKLIIPAFREYGIAGLIYEQRDDTRFYEFKSEAR